MFMLMNGKTGNLASNLVFSKKEKALRHLKRLMHETQNPDLFILEIKEYSMVA